MEMSWDYSKYKNYDYHNVTQKDWNQTLHSAINQISSELGKKHESNTFNLVCGSNIRSLIESLEYYDSDTKTMGSLYVINFDGDDNKVKVVTEDNNGVGFVNIVNYE